MSKIIQNLKFLLHLFGATITMLSCKQTTTIEQVAGSQKVDSHSLLATRYQKMIDYKVDSTAFPRSIEPENGKVRKKPCITRTRWDSQTNNVKVYRSTCFQYI